MIRFLDLTVDQKDLMQSYTMYSKRCSCDLSFSNLITWGFLFNPQYSIIYNCFVLRLRVDGNLAYIPPLLPLELREIEKDNMQEVKNLIRNVIIELRKDACAMGEDFLMLNVDREMVLLLEEIFPQDYRIVSCRSRSDYLYLRENLATLKGKVLQPKRNFANRFRKLYPNYVYSTLAPNMFEKCLELIQERWKYQQQNNQNDIESINIELRSIYNAFKYWEQLDLRGGTIWVNNVLVAFTYGCKINNCTFDICVEKADKTYTGAFAEINRRFAAELPAQYIYINREEDLGIEGLRKAKSSYHPEKMIERNEAHERFSLKLQLDQETIKNQVKTLWKEIFNDPEPFIDLYFSEVYSNENNICCIINNKVVGALQALKRKLLINKNELPAVYISGVCVKKEMQKQNIGNSLMHQTHYKLYSQGIIFALLIPAEQWLFEWYSTLGYTTLGETIEPDKDIMKMNFKEFDKWQHTKDIFLLHDQNSFNTSIKDRARARTFNYNIKQNDTVTKSMIRVINAYSAIELYAKTHNKNETTICVYGDKHIPENNATYIISQGKIVRTHKPMRTEFNLNINQLATFLFESKNFLMTLMMN